MKIYIENVSFGDEFISLKSNWFWILQFKITNPNDTNHSKISFQVEKFHTGLALIYLESIETATGNGNENDQNGISFRREKFRQHILQSTCVQFSYLLSRLESSSAGADLHYEKAILYGKVSIYLFSGWIIYFDFQSAISNQKFCKLHDCGLALPSHFGIIRRQCKNVKPEWHAQFLINCFFSRVSFSVMIFFVDEVVGTYMFDTWNLRFATKSFVSCTVIYKYFHPVFGIFIVLFFNKIPRNQWHFNLQICIHFLFFILFFQIWMYVCTLYNFHENYSGFVVSGLGVWSDEQITCFVFILFFQMKEHEKALRIFVHNIGDFAEAEQYCNQITLGTIHILRTHFKVRWGFKKSQFLYKLRFGLSKRGRVNNWQFLLYVYYFA